MIEEPADPVCEVFFWCADDQLLVCPHRARGERGVSAEDTNPILRAPQTTPKPPPPNSIVLLIRAPAHGFWGDRHQHSAPAPALDYFPVSLRIPPHPCEFSPCHCLRKAFPDHTWSGYLLNLVPQGPLFLLSQHCCFIDISSLSLDCGHVTNRNTKSSICVDSAVLLALSSRLSSSHCPLRFPDCQANAYNEPVFCPC